VCISPVLNQVTQTVNKQIKFTFALQAKDTINQDWELCLPLSSNKETFFLLRAMQYGIVQGDSPSHHTPRRYIISVFQ